MKNVLKVWLVMGLLTPISANAMTIVTSIKPLQLIVSEITKNVSTPDLLISSTASPHDYALRPSDLKKVKDADLVVWFGPGLEPFLEKVVADSDNSLQLSNSAITLREYSEKAHEGHNHGTVDPHIWLGPTQAGQAAKAIATKLSQIDKKNSAVYQANLAEFNVALASTEQEIQTLLSPYHATGYYVFHDAYGYFESYFQLNKLGHFTLSPDRKPGAKTLITIRTALRQGDAKCVFSEPQFTPATIKSVTRGSDVYIGVLDPLATDFELSEGAYFNFLKQLATSYSDCLSYGE